MMSVTQESVKLAFCMQFAGVYWSQGKFLIFLVINCHFGGYFVCILILFFILLEAKCLQLVSNFLAYNLRRKNGFESFFYIIQCFHF